MANKFKFFQQYWTLIVLIIINIIIMLLFVITYIQLSHIPTSNVSLFNEFFNRLQPLIWTTLSLALLSNILNVVINVFNNLQLYTLYKQTGRVYDEKKTENQINIMLWFYLFNAIITIITIVFLILSGTLIPVNDKNLSNYNNNIANGIYIGTILILALKIFNFFFAVFGTR